VDPGAGDAFEGAPAAWWHRAGLHTAALSDLDALRESHLTGGGVPAALAGSAGSPSAHRAGMLERRAGELQREPM